MFFLKKNVFRVRENLDSTCTDVVSYLFNQNKCGPRNRYLKRKILYIVKKKYVLVYQRKYVIMYEKYIHDSYKIIINF